MELLVKLGNKTKSPTSKKMGGGISNHYQKCSKLMSKKCSKLLDGYNLLLSMVLSAILGFVLLMTGPYVAGIITFGIVVGCLFRGLYLLNDIHKRILTISPKRDKVQEALQNHLKERDKDFF